MKLFLKKNWLTFALLIVTAGLITYTGIQTKQHPFYILPLYISLIVGVFQTTASRYANLIGGCNAILYSVANFSFGLYAAAFQALLISFPLQLITFIRWSQNKYKHSTTFKKLSAKGRWLLAGAFLLAFGILYIILDQLGSRYTLVDNASSLISITASLLAIFSFVEFSLFGVLGGLGQVVLYGAVMLDQPAQITYVIYAVYALICVIRQFFSVRKLYAEQQAEEAAKNT